MRHLAGPKIGTLAIALLCGPGSAGAAAPEDDARFEAVAQRYHEAIRKRPYRGPTFDLWYRHYLDAGSLDRLVTEAEDAAQATPDDLPAQLILGLIYERKGRGDDAARVYATARKLAPRRFEPAALLGTLLFRLSRFEEAATALTDAISAAPPPPRHDLLDLLKRLGQSYQRVGRMREAIATWSRITDAFPNDRRVLAELAELLGDEGQIDEAIGRWEQVMSLAAKDPHQQLSARLEIAQLHVRKERFPQALKQLEQALDRVEPDSWLARDIHRRVEALFLRRGDLAGLVAFYTERCRLRPDDLAAARQLAAALTRSGKLDEAVARHRATIAVAPRRRDLREALIGSLERAGRYADALTECRALVETAPSDPDLLKRLGQLTLLAAPEDRREEAERGAIAIWDRLAKLRPDDANAALQAAEACRGAAAGAARESGAGSDKGAAAASPLLEAAESYYREAVRRARGAPVPHEVLGEFLHARGRSREAVAAWSGMAAPPTDTPASWRRLAEVLDHFGYLKDARAASAKALAGEPDNIDFHRLHMRLAVKAKDHDQALAEVAHLERLADRPRQVEQALAARVDVWEAAGALEREGQRLRSAHRKSPLSTRDAWLLGLLLLRDGKATRAAAVLETALEKDPDHLLMMRALAEAHEEAGQRLAALRVYRRLAEHEPGQAVVHLGKIAGLELEVGTPQAAKTAAETLVQRHPGDPDGYRLRAEIAFRLGEAQDGKAWLQRAVRAAPRDLPIRLDLARAVARYGPADEASEHYWRCFELAENLEEKRGIVVSLAEVAQANRTQDQLLHRLRQLRDSQVDSKPLTLCLVEALRALGDLSGARSELEKSLASSPDDIATLKSLAALAATQQDWTAAVGFQEQVVARAPEPAAIEALAEYHLVQGDADGADRALLHLLEADESDAYAAIIGRALDRLDFSMARRLAEAGVRRRPDSWQLRFLAGVTQLATKQPRAAARSFEAVLALPDEGLPGRATAAAKPSRPATPPASTRPATLLRPSTAAPARMGGVNPLASAVIRLQSPLDQIPAGKLPELDDIRDSLAGWEQWEALLVLSQVHAPARPARQPPTARRAPAVAINQQVYQGLSMQWQQVQSQLGLAQQAQDAQAATRLANQAAILQQQMAIIGASLAGGPGRQANPTRNPWHLAGDQRAARQQSLLGLFAAHRQGGQEEEGLRGLRQAAGADPERGRWLVLGSLALGRPADARAAIVELMRSRPEDAFPHVARLFLRRRSPSAASSPAQPPRDAGAGDDAVETRESVQWLIARRPDLRDALTDGLLGVLIAGMGRRDVATEVLSSSVATAELEALPRLARFAAILGEHSILKAIMDRALDLAAGRSDAAAVPSALHDILAANVLFVDDRPYVETTLKLLDRCLEYEGPTSFVAPAPAPAAQVTNRPSRTMAVFEFPPPSPSLDALRLDALRLVSLRCEAVDCVALLAEHLARRAESSTGRAQVSYRLAAGVLKWWKGERGEALVALEHLNGDAPVAAGVSLVMGHAYFLRGEIARALTVLDKAPPDSAAWAAEFDGVRAAIGERLRAGNPDEIVDAILLMLRSRTREADLGFLFPGPAGSTNPPAGQGTVAWGTFPIAPSRVAPARRTVTTIPVPRPAAIRQRSVDELLRHAQLRGTLLAIEQAALAQWETHPESSHLGALVALARFQHDDLAGAATAAERWSKLLAARPELAGAVESLQIVAHCLDHPETRALGRRLGREILPTARARGMSPEVTDLSLRVIQAAVIDGQKDEALEELRRYREALPNPNRPAGHVR